MIKVEFLLCIYNYSFINNKSFFIFSYFFKLIYNILQTYTHILAIFQNCSTFFCKRIRLEIKLMKFVLFLAEQASVNDWISFL